MAAQSKIAVPQSKCTKPYCPLNQASMDHFEGVYKHEGMDVEFSLVFAMSNPHPFIRDANARFWQAQGAKNSAKGDELKEIEKALHKNGSMVGRFLNYHAG